MTINDLIVNGKIKPGSEIVMKKKGQIFKATITTDGKIKDSNGKIHNTPSGAAREFNGGRPIDGWLSWKLATDSKVSLGSLR